MHNSSNHIVGRDDEDGFARRVFEDRLQPGTSVDLWGPLGDFVLESGERPLVFAACDLGFAPVKSLIEHALARGEAPSLSLFWLATRPDGHFMANQCRAWSEALDLFEVALFDDPDPVSGAKQVAGAIRADLFEIDCDFYVAGMDSVATVCMQLRSAGVPASQVFAQEVA